TYERRVSDIAAKAAKPAKWGKLLFRLCQYFEVKNMLEFGTSLGISTAYQAYGALRSSSQIHFVSMEGSTNVLKLAEVNMQELGLQNHVQLVPGNFDHTLDEVLASFDSLDYVFVDGNHRKAPTLEYFEKLLPKAHNDSVFIFDDIYWSKEMAEAWELIKAHPQVRVSVDLFYIGLVFFRKEQVEEHFVLKF
ncbi:MAG: class I SAM-dependent methyltransferase, partial [Bacteroidota bacterium]|nr:class I SAM-dependent methyltransferase [Bacteroidota bacterium]MDX5430570.1 class I SAM-dependent methyltransferase [Bacteroidota bacterium]MDX5469322.1 class I SAM-dependent methyltransferase [Bacteroidota bacterium]